MNKALLIFTGLLLSVFASAQCDTLLIPDSVYKLVKTSSKNGANGGELTFDNDNNTRWRTKGNGPHEIIIDLGASYDVNGFSTRTRWEGSGRLSGYQIFVTNDTTKWGDGEKNDAAKYAVKKNEDTTYFGAVNGRFVKLICESSKADLQISEFRFFRDKCPASGKKNQPIDFPAISKKTTDDAPFTLNATASTGAAISYAIVSGPATVNGSTLTLTKSAGTVKVKGIVAGSATHYSSERVIQFTVIDLADYNPIVSTRLIDDVPLEILDTNVWYPIYINASIDESSFLSIDRVRVEIDGKEFVPIKKEGFYYLAWRPKQYKTHDVKIVVTGSNGNVTTLARNIEVKQGASTQTVTTLDSVVIWFGQQNSRDYYGKHKMPQFTGTYDKIVANLDVACPNNNCDDWDRWAYIEITAPDGNRIQIIRYITPYAVACNHSIDLTEYASLLQGEVEFHVFIDTWGTGGWGLTLDLEYTSGKPNYIYSAVNEIWDGTYDFGNPTKLQPVPQVKHHTVQKTESSKLILSTTGHGWGQDNTGNAAEFYHAKHDILVNGSKIYLQDLWNTCNPNPDNCTGQRGTWTYNRAGWCPGAISPPNKINLDAYTSQSSINLDYKFQASYQDQCHPNNPSCVTGVTCSNCNAGYNPHYQVDAQVISYSNEPIIYGETEKLVGVPDYVNQDKNYQLQLYPNPSSGQFLIGTPGIDGEVGVSIFSVDGVQHMRYFFNSSLELESYNFDISHLENGVYFVEVSNASGSGVSRLVLER
ncbi:MAG: hypothetical protein CL840_09320 [Crocinitomicaceae bacterium]|nr:hypothetical protein [Crocinitomicaceae bacterium]|tara:strand:+ start:8704 stop:10980 length:2277 start_codon:yes stop_codon:yes gene_type:complete